MMKIRSSLKALAAALTAGAGAFITATGDGTLTSAEMVTVALAVLAGAGVTISAESGARPALTVC